MVVFLAIIWIFGTLLLIGATADLNNPSITLAVIGIAIGTWVFLLKARERDRARRIATATNRINSIIRNHEKALATRFNQLVKTDHYGVVDGKPWHKEVDRFWKTVVLPKVDQATVNWFFHRENKGLTINTLIFEAIRPIIAATPKFDDNDPIAFEHFCADIVRKAGWNARVTNASGDQGADVIAEFGELKLVIQCKLYKTPVGNKSVQEAAAARAHEMADYAAVVTNSAYTNAAKQLAATNNVSLLHIGELADYVGKLAVEHP